VSFLSTRRLRWLVQVLFLIGFVVLLDITVVPLPAGLPTDLYLRLSPLNGLVTMLARREVLYTALLPGLLTLVVTAALGRVFCGWFCPMGTTIDLFERVALRRRRYPLPDQKRLDRMRPIKYVLLTGMLAAALLSFQPAAFLDPISMVHRSYITVVHGPVYNLAQDARDAAYRPLRARGRRIQPGAAPRVYHLNAVILVMLGTVLVLSAVQKRFWCRHLCPLGALLALAAHVPLLRRRVSDGCTHCMRCEHDCKMGCIQEKGRSYRSRECILCYNCEALCPTHAVAFPLGVGQEAGRDPSHQLGRRRLLGGAAAGVLWMVGVRSSVAHARTAGRTDLPNQLEENTKSPRRIRPPAALPERQFLQTCIRCGECMKVCPTNALQPALSEGGLEGLFTPVLVPRIGHCEERCNACSRVCPTGAIQNFLIEEKRDRFILGKASIDRSTCRPWYGGKTCSICDEHCSYDAIDTRMIDGAERPVVLEDKCTGCGICERMCPVTPAAAIVVTARDERRPLVDEGLSPLSGFTSQ